MELNSGDTDAEPGVVAPESPDPDVPATAQFREVRTVGRAPSGPTAQTPVCRAEFDEALAAARWGQRNATPLCRDPFSYASRHRARVMFAGY